MTKYKNNYSVNYVIQTDQTLCIQIQNVPSKDNDQLLYFPEFSVNTDYMSAYELKLFEDWAENSSYDIVPPKYTHGPSDPNKETGVRLINTSTNFSLESLDCAVPITENKTTVCSVCGGITTATKSTSYHIESSDLCGDELNKKPIGFNILHEECLSTLVCSLSYLLENPERIMASIL